MTGSRAPPDEKFWRWGMVPPVIAREVGLGRGTILIGWVAVPQDSLKAAAGAAQVSFRIAPAGPAPLSPRDSPGGVCVLMRGHASGGPAEAKGRIEDSL